MSSASASGGASALNGSGWTSVNAARDRRKPSGIAESSTAMRAPPRAPLHHPRATSASPGRGEARNEQQDYQARFTPPGWPGAYAGPRVASGVAGASVGV